MRSEIILATAISAALLISCGHNHSHEGHDHSSETKAVQTHDNEETHGHDHIELCPEAAKAAGISIAKPQKKQFFSTIPATGTILPMSGEIVTVTAKNPGFVVFDAKKIFPGMPVNKGGKLMVVTSEGITSDSYDEQVLQADIAYGSAKLAYERNKALYEDKLVTISVLQESEATFRSAELKRGNLSKGFERGGLRVDSPIGGFVAQVAVAEGDYVETGQTLFSVVKNRNVTLKADVSPVYAGSVSKIFSANFRTSASADFVSVKESGGKLISAGSGMDPQTMMIPVYFSVPYNNDYPAGSFAEIKLLLSESHESIVLPKSAIVEDFGHYFVYVADDDGYEKRDITIGGNDGLNVRILSGIDGNEDVVVTGTARLKLVERLGSLGEEAAHAGHSH